jgi:hypothetical protein
MSFVHMVAWEYRCILLPLVQCFFRISFQIYGSQLAFQTRQYKHFLTYFKHQGRLIKRETFRHTEHGNTVVSKFFYIHFSSQSIFMKLQKDHYKACLHYIL